MKKLFSLVFILTSLSFVFEGCTKSSDVVPSSMTAKLSGSPTVWTAQQCNITVSDKGVNILGYINTPKPVYSSISIQLPLKPVIGTYPISATGGYTTAFYSHDITPVPAAYGTVTFSSVTPYLTGTFSMTLQDSSTITNGSFNIKTPY